jgi:hypothetical protein
MFGKNPYILPLIALVFLAILYFYQKQQKRLAEALRPQEKAGKPVLIINDPLKEQPKGREAKCSNGCGIEYPAGTSIASGHIEFDLLGVKQTGDILLFALCDTKADPCQKDFANEPDRIALLYNTASGLFKLAMTPNAKSTFTESSTGPDRSLPLRISCEWDGKAANLFFNGEQKGKLSVPAQFSSGSYKLYLGHGTLKEDKCNAQMGSLKLSLIR